MKCHVHFMRSYHLNRCIFSMHIKSLLHLQVVLALVAGVMALAISLERERIARTQLADRERHEVTHLHGKRGLITCSVRCVTSILCALFIRTVAVSR